MTQQPEHPHHWMNRIVTAFLGGNLSVLLILVSLIAGVVALWVTPREEDPQIVVPIADIMIQMPGASAREVERQVSTRLEKLLYQIDGVEYVYSTSFASQAVVTVRFYVGEDRERSLVKLHNKIQANIDQIPPGVTGWVVKPVEIDDVPVVNLTLTSAAYDDYALRRMAEELEIRLQSVTSTAGYPPTTCPAGTELGTPLCATIRTPSPIVRCPAIPAWPPIWTPRPILVEPARPT